MGREELRLAPAINPLNARQGSGLADMPQHLTLVQCIAGSRHCCRAPSRACPALQPAIHLSQPEMAAPSEMSASMSFISMLPRAAMAACRKGATRGMRGWGKHETTWAAGITGS